jgi:hypothetical protein
VSYSFTVRAATKAAVLALVVAQLDQVQAQQPQHEFGRVPAESAATAFVNILPDDPNLDVVVSVNGSIGWRGTWGADHSITAAGFGVYARLEPREATGP